MVQYESAVEAVIVVRKIGEGKRPTPDPFVLLLVAIGL